MLSKLSLPQQLEGKWIWHSNEEKNSNCDHLLLRQDFPLFDLPGIAEIWIATHAFFVIFVNGRPCSTGPIPHPGNGKDAFAIHVDITHLLEVGINTIAIEAHTENTPLSKINQTLDGIWVQINLDDKPIVWSDEKWICCQPKCFIDTGLRTAPCDVFVEHVDYRKIQENWTSTDINILLNGSEEKKLDPNFLWKPVDKVSSPFPGQLIPFEQAITSPDSISPQNIHSTGQFAPFCDSLWVSFAPALETQANLGLCIAETYIFSKEEISTNCLCICDEPYIFSVNDRNISAQAVPPLPFRKKITAHITEKLSPQERVSQECQITLHQGWNRIQFAQECQSKHSGALLIWDDLPPNALTSRQKPLDNAPIGWRITPPITLPMALIYPTFDLKDLTEFTFDPSTNPPNDISAYFLTYNFTPDTPPNTQTIPLELGESQYAIFDFGHTRYAYPTISIAGKENDIVDIITTETCPDNNITTYDIGDGGRRFVSTMTLRTGGNRMVFNTPKGVKYLVIAVRKAQNKITVNNISLWQETIDTDEMGQFHCSSPILEKIWNVGVTTLSTTMQRTFIDSPTKDQAQYLLDAMIQSTAAYYIFGAYDRAGRALEAFALSQLATGEINAISPSGLFQALPDYSLLWPTWLLKHYLHTGDKKLVTKLMPVLVKLLSHYNKIAVEPDGPLGDLHDYLGVYAFLDHGNIDRKGIGTGLNGIYCRSLLSASALATQMEMPDLAQTYSQRASKIAQAVRKLTWNQEKKLFADSFYDNCQSNSFSWQSNILAIYGGIANPEQYSVIWEQLFCEDKPLEQMVQPEYDNPLFKFYILEAAFALGKSQWAMRLIHYYWGQMAEEGAKTWWEMYHPGSPDQENRICSKCIGGAVSPNTYLISELVGIRPAKPGMKMVYFSPLIGDVNWVNATIPTPHGFINVNWKFREDDETFEVSINSNYDLEVIPILDPTIAQDAIIKVNDYVSILAPEN